MRLLPSPLPATRRVSLALQGIPDTAGAHPHPGHTPQKIPHFPESECGILPFHDLDETPDPFPSGSSTWFSGHQRLGSALLIARHPFAKGFLAHTPRLGEVIQGLAGFHVHLHCLQTLLDAVRAVMTTGSQVLFMLPPQLFLPLFPVFPQPAVECGAVYAPIDAKRPLGTSDFQVFPYKGDPTLKSVLDPFAPCCFCGWGLCGDLAGCAWCGNGPCWCFWCLLYFHFTPPAGLLGPA